MSHRKFTDTVGRIWDVWSVLPDLTERRSASPEPIGEEIVERRVGLGKLPLPKTLSHGWLTFETVHERRRLAPIPADWEDAPVNTLQQWCAEALEATPPRRVLG